MSAIWHRPPGPFARRQSIMVIYPAHIPAPPAWQPGPFPFSDQTTEAAAVARRRYYSNATARILYGTPEQPTRWHKSLDSTAADAGGFHLFGLELLRGSTPDHGLAVIHIRVTSCAPLDLLRSLARRRNAPTISFDPECYFQPYAELDTSSPPYTVALLTPAAQSLPPLYDRWVYRDFRRTDQWLWALASRTNTNDFPPDTKEVQRQLDTAVPISADWRALVLRDGAAFLGLRPDRGANDPFFGFAELYAHTLYLDALLFGILQHRQIDTITDQVATAFDTSQLRRTLPQLEARIARFRSVFWWQHLTAHGAANDLLLAYQAGHRLNERFDQILTEVADFTRIVQRENDQQINAALGILTLVGLPLGAALETLQVLNYGQPWHLAVGVGSASATSVLLLTTRFGRLVLRSLRPGVAQGGLPSLDKSHHTGDR